MPNAGERNISIWIAGWSAVLSAGIGLVVQGQLVIGGLFALVSVIGLLTLREPPQKYQRRQRYTQALLIMVIISWATLATNLGYQAYIRFIYRQPKVFDSLFVLWGTDIGKSCSAVIDASKILEWQEKYRVALICGFIDPTVDRVKDSRITVTRAYTILNEQTPMSASYSKEMTDGIANILLSARVQAPSPPPGIQAQLQISWVPWWDAVVLPKEVDPADIHTLSDVKDHGGEIGDVLKIVEI